MTIIEPTIKSGSDMEGIPMIRRRNTHRIIHRKHENLDSEKDMSKERQVSSEEEEYRGPGSFILRCQPEVLDLGAEGDDVVVEEYRWV